MGFIDKIKKKINQSDDDLDELDSDSDLGEDGEDAPSASSGGGAVGLALGLLNKVKKKSSGGRNKGGGDADLDDDDDDNTTLGDLDALDGGEGDEDGERPIRRSGIAAKLDGASEAPKEGEEEEEPIPVPVAAGTGGVNLEALFEEEFVIDPKMRDLAESLDDVSAVELAADLREFLEDLQ